MKVYILSEGKLNTGYECRVSCVVYSQQLAEQIMKAFPSLGLHIEEFEVIE